VLVRDLGDRYQLVLQPDHGEVSGQLAAAWSADLGLSPALSEALTCAAARHDDGWAVWERHPRLDDDGRPQVFFAVPRQSLLSSYQACVDVLYPEDPAPALLVSMHVSGLQRNRYGLMDSPEVTPLENLDPPIREFVIAEERRQAQLASELGVDEQERWIAYRQLQVYDVMSLYLGMADVEHGEKATISSLEITPTAPWKFRCTPFPFAKDPLQLSMRRRLLTKREWPDEVGFRAEFAAAPVEERAISFTP